MLWGAFVPAERELGVRADPRPRTGAPRRASGRSCSRGSRWRSCARRCSSLYVPLALAHARRLRSARPAASRDGGAGAARRRPLRLLLAAHARRQPGALPRRAAGRRPGDVAQSWHATIKRYFRGYVRRNGVEIDAALFERTLFLPSLLPTRRQLRRRLRAPAHPRRRAGARRRARPAARRERAARAHRQPRGAAVRLRRSVARHAAAPRATRRCTSAAPSSGAAS